jgi:signal transduction histidine kinase
MKMNFRQKLICNFLIIFTLFTAGVAVFEHRRARGLKTEALQERLDAYADEVSQYMLRHGSRAPLDSLLSLMPPQLRLTLMDRGGNVFFDNALADSIPPDNHADRPEIADAVACGHGIHIRTSASNRRPYLYYAKDNGRTTIIRVALPYDVKIQAFLQPDRAFLGFVIVLFLAGFALIFYIGNHYGRSIAKLRDFSVALHRNPGHEIVLPQFPKDELGEIGGQLVQDFNSIRESRKQLVQEREKLLMHIQTSAEGICFFNPDRTIAFYNGLFLQYYNMISDKPLSAGHTVLDETAFGQMKALPDNGSGENEYSETRIHRNGKEFLARLNIFPDESFEIILTDITAQEKTRRLKQEMTGNIAHELRTPVTSIRGFLEILLNRELDPSKSREYLERAYSQTKTLSELISDMSLLTQMDEKQEFSDSSGGVEIGRLLEKVQADTADALEAKKIRFVSEVPDDLRVRGNETLLYSVFRNLTDNVIRHAGEDIQLIVKVYEIKDGLVHFSFSDTGKGIADERHLNRLFERFYRVGEGRTRDTGGSGLGLAIVKNIILLHGGTITVRNRKEQGLEFMFTLPDNPLR